MADEKRLDPRVEAPGRGSPVRLPARDYNLEQVSAEDVHERASRLGRWPGSGR